MIVSNQHIAEIFQTDFKCLVHNTVIYSRLFLCEKLYHADLVLAIYETVSMDNTNGPGDKELVSYVWTGRISVPVTSSE